MRNYTEEKEIFDLKQQGIRAEDIAIKYKIDVDKIRAILRRYSDENSEKMVHYRDRIKEKDIVTLYRQGHSIVEIAKRYGCTRQNISVFIRRFCKEEGVKNVIILRHHCVICGGDEFDEIIRKASEGERFWKYVPVFLMKCTCAECKRKNLYKCRRRECGHIGSEEDFLPSSILEHVRTGFCKACNARVTLNYVKENYSSWKKVSDRWKKKNPDYHKTYWKNRRRKAEKEGVCLYCGEPLDDLNFRNCSECRERFRVRPKEKD